MPLESEKIVPVFIEEEMKTSYIDYSMSVITNRALPDVRDGLKPSNRRILVAMNDLGLAPNRRIVNAPRSPAIPRVTTILTASRWSIPRSCAWRRISTCATSLVDGQGNFGSIDGDGAAAMRYTEARLTPIAMEMLADLEKDTVAMRPNYDETREEPTVLPSKFPNLICNGASGIAVGMATNIPPHNLSETVDALCALIDDPELTSEDLMQHIKGPDFPTGGTDFRRRRHAPGIPHRTRPLLSSAPRPTSRFRRTAASISSSAKFPTRSTNRTCSSRSPNWCATRRSRASPTCATNPTATACGS